MIEESCQKELQGILLNVAKEFHRVCENNSIPYYMLGGTMLGAVRHKGFIPWDDDMDFGVMEEEWDKLIDALNRELPDYYKVRDVNNTDSISNPSIKIEDARTIMQEVEKEGRKNVVGINIDIFPLNYTNEKKNVFSRNGLIEKIIRLNWCRFLDYKTKPIVKRILAKIFKALLMPFPKTFLIHVIRKYLILNKGQCVTNYWGAWINKEIVPIGVMGTPVKYEFENCCFFGVAKPQEYLSHLYGDYMRIPSKEEIHYHVVKWGRRNEM